MKTTVAVLLLTVVMTSDVEAQGRGGGRGGAPRDTTGQGGAPALGGILERSARESDLRVAMRRFDEDLSVLRQRYDVPMSPVRIQRERAFYQGWLAQLDALGADAINEAGRADRTRLQTRIQTALAELVAQERQLTEMAPLVAFARPLQALQEQRRDRLDLNAQQAAQTIEDVKKEVLRLTAAVQARAQGSTTQPQSSQPSFAPTSATRPTTPVDLSGITPALATSAVAFLSELRTPLNSWYTFYFGFDPLFNWWVRVPYEELQQALRAYEAAIRKEWALPAPEIFRDSLPDLPWRHP